MNLFMLDAVPPKTVLDFIRAPVWNVGFQQEKLLVAPCQVVTERQKVFFLAVSRQFLNVANLLFTRKLWLNKADDPDLVGKVVIGPSSMSVSDLEVDFFQDRHDCNDIVEV